MASTTVLLDLPNELFLYVFQYLRSIDILKAFFGLQSRRVRAFIQPFIRRLDISQESDQCIRSSLADVFLKNENIVLRIQMKHLSLVEEYLSSNQIRSLQVMNWDMDFHFSDEIVRQLCRNLKELSLIFAELGEIDYRRVQFFQSDCQLEHLTIKDCVLSYYDTTLEICTRLKHLSIELEGMHPLFLFLQHLPNLQELKVKMVSQECFSQAEPNLTGVKSCPTLRSVTFTGWIKYFSHLETFFSTFGSTIEYLSLHIRLTFLIVDGTRLEQQLLNKMARLTSLDLNIFSTFSDDPIQIETFQSFIWEQLNPIVYWYDIHAQQHTMFTLPYKSDHFEHLSNDFVTTCVSNRAISLRFERVHTLSLINTTPLNLETFLLIEKVFPNVRTIELVEKYIHPLQGIEEDEEEREIGILSMAEDLLSNTSLQIPSVTKFCVAVDDQRIDYKTFYHFLHIFPSLVDVKVSINHPLLQDLLEHKNEDHLVEIALARINQLIIKSSCEEEEDTLTDANIRHLFPNIKSVAIAKSYSEE